MTLSTAIQRLVIHALMAILTGLPLMAHAQEISPQFSTAGYFALPKTGREVFSMNPNWLFHKGDVQDAEQVHFNDTDWQLVNLPNGIEYLPTEASGGINYQGVVWYRKHFTLPTAARHKQLTLYFEAIMGKCKVYCNGKLVKEHFGGYLPIVIDVTRYLHPQGENVIAVMADNSNDGSYPPGKPQEMLDFTYFGGIYRDCWLVTHNKVFITDPNQEQITAGGGLLVHYDNVSEKSATVALQLHLRNLQQKVFEGKIEYTLLPPKQSKFKKQWVVKQKVKVLSDSASTFVQNITVKEPDLWSPDHPQLYNLLVRILDKHGKVIDGYRQRLGIRSFAFKGKDGFWLNGKPYPTPLIGANRHQDYAVVGNALSNNLHWRDAKKLRDAGLKVIRNAHCPQDPAFMDACDELGLLVIVNTPGWQYWNNQPIFAKRVYDDIRQMIRRDRNHASVWMWEPILNETWYPEDFAKNTTQIAKDEFPFSPCYTVSDSEAKGHQYFSVLYAHPTNGNTRHGLKAMADSICYFTREWGDNVDDWNSHNSPSRVARNWGEMPMLIQAQHYAHPDYRYTCYDALYRTTRQHVGGCLWHSFDHQRGYHPDPFYGGLMDVFRQPKYSYYMMQAQRPATVEDRPFSTGPVLHIAHAMTPFSPKDVTVYSNCDEVHLTFNKGGKTYVYHRPKKEKGMPSPVITFKNVYDFMADKHLSMDEHRQNDVFLAATGYINGKVVATDTVRPARRPTKILLWLDNEHQTVRANGSDVVTVVAAIADQNGVIKRLNNQEIVFHVQGEGKILGDANIMANPTPVRWGTAPVLVKSTLTPGKVTITASVVHKGSQTPVSGTLTFETLPARFPAIYTPTTQQEKATISTTVPQIDIEKEKRQQAENAKRLKVVEQQQKDFGEKN